MHFSVIVITKDFSKAEIAKARAIFADYANPADGYITIVVDCHT